ncbi:hypothetical protein [Candidatus Magnetaquicoccus inordinatus]|uniref:hypothetical protein n=1 Tax=Candidatus Magnetaquicoccus inordinatus TaxID=2496818 RepID=UPI00102CDAFD|nr:hypothetical protein [Candidatus Magnetaquicoccus inordinatus]
MSEERRFKPLIKLAGLYENQSQRSGETYFAGYLGSAKVVVLRDKNAEPGKPTWSLCIQEREPKAEEGGGGAGQSQGYGQSSQRQGYGQSQRPSVQRQGMQVTQPAQQTQPHGVVDYGDDLPF